jgi:import inner membrane translocase subunit TIM22
VIVIGLCQYEASKLVTKHVFARADFPESGWENAMAGGGMGVFMGMLFGALDTPLHAETMTARQQFVHAARTMGSRSMHMAKTFAIMGAIFSGTECLIEKARAKHDAVNTATAGCVTGGSMSARAGPQAACLGCAGFAGFSLLIEKIFDRHE